MSTDQNEDPILARIKPINPRKGQNTKSYTVAGRRFTVEDGWVVVSESVARILYKCTVDGEDHSARVFDVMLRSQAIKLEQKEMIELQRAQARRASAIEPLGSARRPKGTDGVMTTADLNPPEEDEFALAIRGGDIADPMADEFAESLAADDDDDLNAPKARYGETAATTLAADEARYVGTPEETDPDLAPVAPAPAPVVPGAPGAPARASRAQRRAR